MMTKDIEAYVAGLKVLEFYGVHNLFGYPAGSLNLLMNALNQEKDQVKYIQIRHEQVTTLDQRVPVLLI